MPSNIIPDQSTNIDTMLDGNILHGEQSGGDPYIKELYEIIINNINTLNSESNVTPGASSIGVKTDAFINFTKATNDVEACLEGIDTELGILASATTAIGYEFFAKYLYAPQWNATQAIIKGNNTIQEIRAFLEIDAGNQIDGMGDVTSWSSPNSGVNIAVDSNVWVEGGSSVTFDKTTGNILCTISKTYSTFDMTGQKFRMYAQVPDITKVANLWIKLATDATNYKIWTLTTDVKGDSLAQKWQLFEVDPAVGGSEVGTFDITDITIVEIGVETNLANDVFTGLKFDHLVRVQDTVPLNINVYINNVALLSGADSYTFPDLRAGQVVTKSPTFNIPSVAANDIVHVGVETTGTYNGENVTLYLKA